MSSFNFSRLIKGPWSISWVIALISINALALLAVALIALGWIGGKDFMLTAAQENARQNSEIVSLHIQKSIDPATAVLRVISQGEIAGIYDKKSRFAKLPLFIQEMQANHLVSAMYMGYTNGDFLLIRPLRHPELRARLNPPKEAHYLVQLIQRNQKIIGSHHFLSDSMELLESREVPDYIFDPRQRPWYQKAKNQPGVSASDPYLFFTTKEVGVSLAIESPIDGTVFGLDLALDDLSEMLNQLEVIPHTEMAIIDGKGTVIAYPDVSQILLKTEGDGFRLKNIVELGVEPLSDIYQKFSPDGGWLGLSLRLGISGDLYLIIASPLDQILLKAYSVRQKLLTTAANLIAAFLVVGLMGSSLISRRLGMLLWQVGRMARFDFSRVKSKKGFIKESNDLQEMTNTVSQMMQTFLEISAIVSKETNTKSMLAQVLEKCRIATRSEAGAVYLIHPENNKKMKKVAYSGENYEGYESIDLDGEYDFWKNQNKLHHQGRLEQMRFNLIGRDQSVVGMLVLLKQESEKSEEALQFKSFVERLSGLLAVTVETHALITSQEKLLNGIIKMLADAIDAKSPYTSGHCERVPELALMLVDSLSAEKEGDYAGFNMNTRQRQAFYLGAWLHDCGKIVTPEHIIDKATKLELIYNRIHEVRTRFEVLWRDAEITCLQAILAGADIEEAEKTCQQQQEQLQNDFSFIARCNIGGEFLSQDDIDKIVKIGEKTWIRYFDDTKGLSQEELMQRGITSGSATTSQTEVAESYQPSLAYLLQDHPHDCIAWGQRRPAVTPGEAENHLGFDMALPQYLQNKGEVYNLSVRRGTLTEEDRFIINNHMVSTLEMLNQLPWPKGLEEVPEIAGNHHERMDGKGYPRKLNASTLPISHRVMALADVFEALTAKDRPYKEGKTLSETFSIMVQMSLNHHLDSQLLVYFIKSKVWLQYAEKFLSKEQINQVDINSLVAKLEQNIEYA